MPVLLTLWSRLLPHGAEWLGLGNTETEGSMCGFLVNTRSSVFPPVWVDWAMSLTKKFCDHNSDIRPIMAFSSDDEPALGEHAGHMVCGRLNSRKTIELKNGM